MNSHFLKTLIIFSICFTKIYAQIIPPPPPPPEDLTTKEEEKWASKFGGLEIETLNSQLPENNKIYLKNGLAIFGKQSKFKLRSAILNNKLGFVDLNDSLVIPAVYDIKKDVLSKDLFYSGDNIVTLSKNGKYGCIDKYNNEIIPFKYDKIEQNVVILIASNGLKHDFYDDFGNFIFSGEFQKVEMLGFPEFPYVVLKFKKNNKYGLIDCSGNVLIKNKYDEISILADLNYDSNLITVSEKGKTKIINGQEKIILESDFKIFEKLGNYYLVRKNGKFGLMNEKGRLVLEIKYSYISSLNYSEENKDFPKMAIYENDKKGIFDCKTEKVIILPKYDLLEDWGNDLYLGKLNDKYFLLKNSKVLNLNGEKGIIRPFDSKYSFNGDKLNDIFLIKNFENKIGIYDANMESFIVPQKYDSIKVITRNFFITKLNEKFGILNHKNESIFPNNYFKISNTLDPYYFLFTIENGTKKGLTNILGDVLLPVEYDSIELGGFSSLKLKKDNKFGIMVIGKLFGRLSTFSEMVNSDIGNGNSTEETENFIEENSFKIDGKRYKIIRNKFVEIK
ncbi:MAG: WG repeat-containing protein [Bacteroidetes bacterium]|nr:WG repeat-containing protein [Bacteroidota bacterium]